MNKPADNTDSSNLDFLRSVAVMMVLFDHVCRHYHWDFVGPFAVVDVGYFGVLLFFVHTSLVLMRSMERSRLWSWALLANFYVRRLFRIYPLSILAVLMAVAFRLHAEGRGLAFGIRPGPGELFSNLFLIQNLTYSDSVIGPLWSLVPLPSLPVHVPQALGLEVDGVVGCLRTPRTLRGDDSCARMVHPAALRAKLLAGGDRLHVAAEAAYSVVFVAAVCTGDRHGLCIPWDAEGWRRIVPVIGTADTFLFRNQFWSAEARE